VNATRNRMLRLDPARYHPVINVMVEEHFDEQGNPRCEIRRGEQVLAVSGVNWRSPIFAEVYVHVASASRGRGWGQAVVSACVATLLAMGVTPVYIADQTNAASLELAQRVGFVDTGAREIVGEALIKQPEVGQENA